MRNQLYIGGLEVDTIENLDINITKEIYSISDPSKRKSDFSKTVAIPGSKGNDNIFASLFDVNMSIRSATQLNPDFNPTKKASCVYFQDSFRQIKGYCQLDEIVILENNKVIYNIVIYGQNSTLFSDISNLTLNDLTTLGTAVWDDASIVASWTDTWDPTPKPVYPYLNRGKAVFNRSGSIAEWSYNYEAFKPWVYTKDILTAIISEAGYSIEEAQFFDSAQFLKLIMECDVKKFQQDSAAIAATEVQAIRATSNQTITPVSNANVGNLSLVWDTQIIYNFEQSDPASQYNPSTGTLTIAAASEGYASIVTSFSANITFGASLSGVNVQFVMIRKRSGVYSPLVFHNHFLGSVTSGNLNNFSIVNYLLQSELFETGDEVRICLLGATSTTGQQNNNISNFNITTATNNFGFFIDGQIQYGQTYNIADVLPNMKQTDFLMAIFKMFNIYLDFVPNEGLVMEPRDDYFTEDIVDWTDKLDTYKDFKIVPQGLLENKEILFRYTSNNDDLNSEFKSETRYDYGYKRLIFDNDFKKDKKELVIPFSLCPLKVDTDFGNINMITMFDGNGQERTGNPLIAYFGGMKTGNMVYWDQTSTRTAYTQYPFAGPVDDVISPNYDLSFGRQDRYFYTTPGSNGLVLTDNYLYKQFHERQWQETGHRDSKLIEGWFKLNADDIQALSFRVQYWIREAYYRLLEVSDYNPDGRSTTLCKFLKLNTYTVSSPATETIPGGGGQGGTNVEIGDIFREMRNGTLKAWGNKIGKNVTGVQVNGTGNTVGDGAVQILIQGNGNTILPGVQNVTLINTDDLVISENDVLYIGGKKVIVGTPSNEQVWTYNSSTGVIEFQTPATITKRIDTIVDSTTPTPNAGAGDDFDFHITALANNATFGAPSGTPADGQVMIIRVKDDGTPRTLAFNAIYRPIGVTLPTLTVAGKTLYIGCKYNTADTKWDVLAVGQEI